MIDLDLSEERAERARDADRPPYGTDGRDAECFRYRARPFHHHIRYDHCVEARPRSSKRLRIRKLEAIDRASKHRDRRQRYVEQQTIGEWPRTALLSGLAFIKCNHSEAGRNRFAHPFTCHDEHTTIDHCTQFGDACGRQLIS